MKLNKVALIVISLVVIGMLATVPIGLWITMALVKSPPKQFEISSTGITTTPDPTDSITEPFVPYHQRKPQVVWDGKEEGRRYLRRWRATSVGTTTTVKVHEFNTTTPTPYLTTTAWKSATATANATSTTDTSKSTISTFVFEHDNITTTGLGNTSLSTPLIKFTQKPTLIAPTATTFTTLKPFRIHKFTADRYKAFFNKSIEDDPIFIRTNETNNQTIGVTWAQQQTTNVTIKILPTTLKSTSDLSTATNESTTAEDESATLDMNNQNQTESNLNETLYYIANNLNQNVTTIKPETALVATTNTTEIQTWLNTTEKPKLATMSTFKPTQNDTDNPPNTTTNQNPSIHHVHQSNQTTTEPIYLYKFPAGKIKSLVNESGLDIPSFTRTNKTETMSTNLTTTNLTATIPTTTNFTTIIFPLTGLSSKQDIQIATNSTAMADVESTTSKTSLSIQNNNKTQNESNLNNTLSYIANNYTQNLTTMKPETEVLTTTNASFIENLQETTRTPELTTMMTYKPAQYDPDDTQNTTSKKPLMHHHQSKETSTDPSFDEISSTQNWTAEPTTQNLDSSSTTTFETQLTTKHLTLASLDDKFLVDNLTYTGTNETLNSEVTQIPIVQTQIEQTTQYNHDFKISSRLLETPMEATTVISTNWENQFPVDKQTRIEKRANSSISIGVFTKVVTTTQRTKMPISYSTKGTTIIPKSFSNITSAPKLALILMTTPKIMTKQTTSSTLKFQTTQEIMANETSALETGSTGIEHNVISTVNKPNGTTTSSPLVSVSKNSTMGSIGARLMVTTTKSLLMQTTPNIIRHSDNLKTGQNITSEITTPKDEANMTNSSNFTNGPRDMTTVESTMVPTMASSVNDPTLATAKTFVPNSNSTNANPMYQIDNATSTTRGSAIRNINNQSFYARSPNSELLMPSFFPPKNSKVQPALLSDDWEDEDGYTR